MTKKKATLLMSIINKYLTLRGYDHLICIAKPAGVSVSTMTRRKKEPQYFRLDELMRIVRFLKIPAEELTPVWDA